MNTEDKEFIKSEINLMLDEEYPSLRIKSQAVMSFIIKHETKRLLWVESLMQVLITRNEDDLIKTAALRTTFRYYESIPSWGRLLYEHSHCRPGLLVGLINEKTFLHYLRS